MTKLTVPRWFIRCKALEGGIRLPKRPEKQHFGFVQSYPADQSRPNNVTTISPDAGAVPSGRKIGDLWDIDQLYTGVGEKFDPGDYRYWFPYMNTWGIINRVMCRKCGSLCLTKWSRKSHFEQTSCGGTLVESYKLLLRDRKCIMCDAISKKMRWGIPFCSENCIYQWAIGQPKPQALGLALDLVERNKNAAQR